MIELSTPDFEFVPAIAAAVDGGSVKGPAEFRRFLTGLNETWETFRIEVDELERILEGELRKLPRRILGQPERPALDRSAKADMGVRL